MLRSAENYAFIEEWNTEKSDSSPLKILECQSKLIQKVDQSQAYDA
jgi:hypothetical protein